MSKLLPKYTFWDGLNVALTLGMQALEEIRALARLPGPEGKDGINGRDGKDGKNGKDGIGFDDVDEFEEDDGRILVRRFYCGGQIFKEFRHQTKMVIYRGVYDQAKTYQPGDMATWNGSLWHCNKEVSGKIGSDHWTLAVKKGRDGKD